MNFLAHLYLSRNHELLSVGNFMADHVKGNNLSKFPKEVADGIRFHRLIDELTDNDENYREVKKMFVPSHDRYSGVVTDIVYDYILASRWHIFEPTISLEKFQEHTNTSLLKHFFLLPLSTKLIVPFFVRNKWLILYSKKESIARVLTGMNRYRRIKGDVAVAIRILSENENTIETACIHTIKKVQQNVSVKFPEYNVFR